MKTTQKQIIKLFAFVFISLVVALSLVLVSCKQDPSAGSKETTAGSTVQIAPPSRDTSGATMVGASLSITDKASPVYKSPSDIVLSRDGSRMYVSDETAGCVYEYGTDGALISTLVVDCAVNALEITDDGTLYALVGGAKGKLLKIKNMAIISETDVGHTPEDMAVVGKKGYVVNRFSANVSVVDLETMSIISEIAIDGREPNCIAVAGSMLFVGCHLSDEATDAAVMSANVCVIDSASDKITKTIPLVNGASGLKDICVSPDGERVYASHVIGRYTYPTTQLDRGWVNTNGFSVITVADASLYCTVLIDEVDEGAANPWGITVSADGKYLCVAVSGTNEVMLIDIDKMNRRISSVVKGNGLVNSLVDVVDYIPFLADIEERVGVGTGVREIYENNGKLYCALYFDGAVDVIDLATKSVNRLVSMDQPEAVGARKGQILFSDANNCYQKWQSCNSCHPDGIVDGFNWDNLNDGLGNAKSAKSMLYAHRTPPVMVTGIRDNAEIAVAAGMKFIQFNTLPAEELAYIDEYLRSMMPVQSPALNKDGTLTELAADGKALFEANCASCHPAPLYTNLNKYDVGTRTENDDGLYDTPSLVEVWRTAPYMHDGSFKTLEDAVRFFGKNLNDSEVKALSAFVSSIGNENEVYAAEQVFTEQSGKVSYNKYVIGATLTGLTVRKQQITAPNALACIHVYGKDGSLEYYSDVMLTDIPFNETVTIELQGEIVLEDGGSISVEFYGEGGKSLASPLIIK